MSLPSPLRTGLALLLLCSAVVLGAIGHDHDAAHEQAECAACVLASHGHATTAAAVEIAVAPVSAEVVRVAAAAPLLPPVSPSVAPRGPPAA